jgi:phosphomannomutase/phosphoglucomutase
MFPRPVPSLSPNSFAFETEPLVKPTGFREYDARWWFGHPASGKPPELNLMGVQALGLGLGTLIHRLGVAPDIVVGHDYRSYSGSIKLALIAGLMASGCRVKDIGLSLSPMAYFAQFDLDCAAVAMVTASHNDNGWTGVKMGADRPLTFGPEEMGALRDIVIGGDSQPRAGGSYEYISGFRERYLDDLADRPKLSRKLKVVVACGNGTAGAFAPQLLDRVGCDIVPLDVELDHSFPRYNPNPEDMKMLHVLADTVRDSSADVGFGFDGDGDRCGVVDDHGHEIFADKVGVLLARDLSERIPDAKFVVDVKSTGLYEVDPVLKANGVVTDYWKTGHSYIKRRTSELGAVAGFEKSGHYFFNPPIGRGYDDSIVAAIAVLEMLDRAGKKRISELIDELPKTWGSPTMAPYCPDERKYQVVDSVTKEYEQLAARGEKLLGQKIARLVTVNGVRVTLEDGTWGLVRASSNKPSLVVVCESPVSDERMRAMFREVDGRLRKYPEVGEYDQKI